MSQVQVEKKVLNENDKIAAELRERFRAAGVLVVNIISSPGSGKTALLEKTLETLGKKLRMAVLTGDLQTENDANRLKRWGAPVKQILTGTGCHLTARQVETHLADWPLDQLDILIVENVGNLVCPAGYDLGEEGKVVLLSVTEGEDKPLKYPPIFFRSELMILSKTDLLPYVPFDAEVAKQNARSVHPGLEILPLSVRSGEGFEAWTAWLVRKLAQVRSRES
jgi:hydrogenase nickel incorporation protein HypB